MIALNLLPSINMMTSRRFALNLLPIIQMRTDMRFTLSLLPTFQMNTVTLGHHPNLLSAVVFTHQHDDFEYGHHDNQHSDYLYGDYDDFGSYSDHSGDAYHNDGGDCYY